MSENVHFMSETDQWSTPQDLFDKLNGLFNFETDVCADENNTKCDKFYSVEDDGLRQDWQGVCWCNPPYGREIPKWIEKAYTSSVENNATVVCLVLARVDTRWWHDYCVKGEMFFIKGRLKFGDAKSSAPFPSAIVIFRPKLSDVLEGFSGSN